jgi:biotin synthase
VTREEILGWLCERREERLAQLWRTADHVRHECVGQAVHLRGLIEISSHCIRRCWYCGLRHPNGRAIRYRMTESEVMDAVGRAVAFGYGTVVIQSGEDYGLSREWVAKLVSRIKRETRLAVTLSLGERPDEDLITWRQAGADRYLLRFETSNRALYDWIHPSLPGRTSDRVAMLRRLGEMGYEIGGGGMVGIPGQTYDDLADDVELYRALDLDMIGIGPYLPHPQTPLARVGPELHAPPGRQVPNTELMTHKVLALARIVCPLANIPSTTAIATLNGHTGRELALMRGANVVMPNLTPMPYRSMYEIYPFKACLSEPPDCFHGRLRKQIAAIGRTIGTGRGDSPRRLSALRPRALGA